LKLSWSEYFSPAVGKKLEIILSTYRAVPDKKTLHIWVSKKPPTASVLDCLIEEDNLPVHVLISALFIIGLVVLTNGSQWVEITVPPAAVKK
jgi:hypothetical protein